MSRFTYDYKKNEGTLFDNDYHTFYPIIDSEDNIKLFCKRLNDLQDVYINKKSYEMNRDNYQNQIRVLEQKLNNFDFRYTQYFKECNKDELYLKDIHTEITLKNENICIKVYYPQNNGVIKMNYRICGKQIMREYI